MKAISSILFIFFINLFAQDTQNDEIQKALQQFMILLEKSQQTIKELSNTTQNAVVEEKDGFELFYKRVTNAQKVEKRADLLIKTQIDYKFLRDKELPSSYILTVVKDGKVQLFGKVYSKKSALKAMDIAIHTKGVKEVTSYLIIKNIQGVLL